MRVQLYRAPTGLPTAGRDDATCAPDDCPTWTIICCVKHAAAESGRSVLERCAQTITTYRRISGFVRAHSSTLCRVSEVSPSLKARVWLLQSRTGDFTRASRLSWTRVARSGGQRPAKGPKHCWYAQADSSKETQALLVCIARLYDSQGIVMLISAVAAGTAPPVLTVRGIS